MPDFLPPDLQARRDAVADLARHVLAPLRDDTALGTAERAARVRAASQAAGLYGLTQADDSAELLLLVVRETLARHCVAQLPGLFGAPAGVLAGVGEPLRSSHLLPLLAGDKRGGFAFTEPADAPRPTWARVDGDRLLVTGRKSYVTGGADADFMTALVDIEGRGPAMVVIDTATPGVTLQRRFSSLDGSHHAAFAFDAVAVPLSHVVGAPGDGRSRALATISRMRRAIAAEAAGTLAWVVDDLARELQRERRGGARADSERMRLRYGELRIQAFGVRAAVYRAARLADAGEDVVNESIAAKVLATEAVHQGVDMAVQLVGGEALVDDHPLAQALRRVRAWRLAEGETDTLRINVARGHLDLAKGRL
ncbi:MAG: acyl-CoA dehydrogenase family protein [Aquabacterium sp.]